MPSPEPTFDQDGDGDEQAVSSDEINESSFAGKDLDALQDEFEDEETRQSER